MAREGDRWLLVSVHDVTPAHADRLETALRLLEEWGIDRGTLLVVPDFHGRWLLTDHPAFCDWIAEIRGRGWEVALHGFSHRQDVSLPRASVRSRLAGRWLTDREGEFLALDRESARRRLERGLAVLRKAMGVRPAGFVPPAWLCSDEALKAVEKAGFGFFEQHLALDDLSRGRRVLSPVVAWASRSSTRRVLSRVWAKAAVPLLARMTVVRVAVHPGDVEHAALIDSIHRTVERLLAAGFRPVTYSEYLDM